MYNVETCCNAKCFILKWPWLNFHVRTDSELCSDSSAHQCTGCFREEGAIPSPWLHLLPCCAIVQHQEVMLLIGGEKRKVLSEKTAY